MRLESVFLSVRRTVSWLKASTTPSWAPLSDRRRRLHSERPSGACEQANRINSASFSPLSLRSYSRSGLLRLTVPSRPRSQKRRRIPATPPLESSKASPIRSSDQAGPSGPSSAFSNVGLQQNPSAPLLTDRSLPTANPFKEATSLFLRKLDTVCFLCHEIEALVRRLEPERYGAGPKQSRVTQH